MAGSLEKMSPEDFRAWAGLADPALHPGRHRLEEMGNPVDMSIWPSVFVTGQVAADVLASVEAGGPVAKIKACADALLAWGHCMAGNKPPEKFGWGMIALAEWAGLSTDDLLARNAKKVADAASAQITAQKAGLSA